MLLHQLGSDRWTVLAIARSETQCELRDVLITPDPNRLGARMLALLQQELPTRGPRHNEEISKHLRGDIYEFRKTPGRGPALRVLWFYDEGKIIVCTHGFWKTTRRTPHTEIDQAENLRKKYLLAKRTGSVRIIVATW